MDLRFATVIILIAISDVANAARGGGRGRGGSRKGGNRGSMKQIFIPRNPEGANYYDNSNVSVSLLSNLSAWSGSHLTVSQGAKIIKSSHFELDYMLGRKITFFCMAQGIPRPHITWFKDGVELYSHRCFQVTDRVFGIVFQHNDIFIHQYLLFYIGTRVDNW